MIKKLKTMSFIIIAIILGLVIGVYLFINFSPQFGGSISKDQQKIYAKSGNNKAGKFINQSNINLEMSVSDIGKMLIKSLNPPKGTKPEKAIQVQKIDSLNLTQHNEKTQLFWFGHSTFLIQMNNVNILIDPMFGDVPAPHPLLGGNRFSKEIPIEIEQLPDIDAVLISHDHYDHLDYESIQKLKHKVGIFYTPLGVGIHLEAWEIEKERIIELDWWEEIKFSSLTFKCTPAQHFSGRGLTDRANTLWCSWVIQSATENIFFSGDSGYGPHFKEIGEKYGPFDFAMLECGQYNEMWSEIHMFPEETVQAAIDLKAKKIMPIHWGAFKLAIHKWTDPIERISIKAKELNVNLLIPEIGASIILDTAIVKENTNWWK